MEKLIAYIHEATEEAYMARIDTLLEDNPEGYIRSSSHNNPKNGYTGEFLVAI